MNIVQHKAQKTSLLITLFILISLKSSGLNPIILNSTDSEWIIGDSTFALLEDSSAQLTIDDILSPTCQKGFKVYTSDNEVPYSNANYESTYWIKFKVSNLSSFDRWYILESYAPHTESLKFYLPNENGQYIEKKSGFDMYFYQREYINKNLILDLPIPKGQVKTFYLRVHSPKYWSGFDFRIKPIKEWTHYSTSEYFFLGLFYGILLIMAAYNLLLYFTLRERVYILFVIYILFGLLVTSFDDGLGHQFIWFKARELFSAMGLYVFPIGLTLSFIFYSRNFLELKKRHKSLDKILLFIGTGYVVYHLLHHIIGYFWPQLPYFRFINAIPYLFVFAISVKSYKDQFRPARYFMIGSGFIALSIIIIQLRANNHIPGNLFTVYSLNYGLVTDILFFSLALSERIKFIKQNEQKAQQKIIEQLEENAQLRTKVNRELEEKVKEKTKELNEQMELLNESNEKLAFAVEELKSMNVTLDLDNWKLKKTIKKETELRLSDKELTFEGFSKLYPDKITCLKKINDLKWGEDEKGYLCKKCGHNNFSKGPQPYSKKCTKCNYTETVTSYTLFHGVRFPLNKALYLTYLISRDEKKTIESLSEAVDLRMNTCWNFKKKVVSRKEETKKKFKIKDINNWEQIIVH